MKKYITFIIGVLLIASCSNGLENRAKEQLKKTMKEKLDNPDSAKLTNVKTELNNDSLCIIHFKCKAQNGLGVYNSTDYEYIYLKCDKDCYRESLIDLDEKESVIKRALDLLITKIDNGGDDYMKNKSDAEFKKDSIESIFTIALGQVLFHGREVKEDTGEEIKL